MKSIFPWRANFVGDCTQVLLHSAYLCRIWLCADLRCVHAACFGALRGEMYSGIAHGR